MLSSSSPATARQLWALYCITKKDYRSENLTYEKASQLIAELGDPNYKKAKTETSEKSIADRLFDYIATPEYFKEVKSNCVVTGYVESTDLLGNRIPDTPRYAFVGHGCGITYLKYDGRSKKAKAYEEIVRSVRRRVETWLCNQFTNDEREYFKSIGCPLEAVIWQDQEIQCLFFSKAVEFGVNELGIKSLTYHSVLD